ncbi:hypothetical protein DUNSADRAFT_11262 [Dunaliella salina]|uniref:Prolyl 4-hydroxylase alpha subunit Fe(2+) 2OG dioxygenase domain-containing protein n=1 Tax=Dunaliella salina TaxID=3046 RepID=A0ABQ7GDR8_DUNSA|nr:hypothetical protein DUNSADRAFT_11262 [Dunaliella salina]|eukprot:KAF5832743.1 hypothetical protein DUNSADRAFT_11262 [Dunaliella salina]
MSNADFFVPVTTHDTSWDPHRVSVPLCVSLDACFVPISSGGVRLDTANVVVLDDFISERERQELLDFITHPGWDHAQGPPADRWEKATSDAADQPRTWGLKSEFLKQLSCSCMRAKVEVQSRLCKLYPEVIWCHQPSDAIQQSVVQSEEHAGAHPGARSGASEGGHDQQDAVVRGHDQQQDETRAADGSCQGRGISCAVPPQGCHTCGEAGNQGSGALMLSRLPCGAPSSCQGQAGRDHAPAPCHQAQQFPTPPEQGSGAAAVVVDGGPEQGRTADAPALQKESSRDAEPHLDVNSRAAAASTAACEHRGPPASSQGVHHIAGADEDSEDSDDVPEAPCTREDRSFDCSSMLANAATHGDKFGWHQDADPMTFPPSLFTSTYGWYANREPGKPLFVSLILYLNDFWPKEWDAETMFLDVPSDTGIAVRPKAYRAVLMDQDVLHRLSQPSHRAGGCPRYSLVWKLVMLPRSSGQQCCIARADWGPPTCFGSSAKADAVVRQMARKRKAAELAA